jgi:hypothetical protein
MIKKETLKQNYFVFGNKGTVWSNTAHIYQSGNGNLCGTPALSSNHAGNEGMDVGCPECIQKYNEVNGGNK